MSAIACVMPKLPYPRSTTNKSTGEEVNLQRGGPDNRGPRYACSHRERLVEESLTGFRAVRDGKYKAGEAYPRMKQSLADPNEGSPRMWDLPAFAWSRRTITTVPETSERSTPLMTSHIVYAMLSKRYPTPWVLRISSNLASHMTGYLKCLVSRSPSLKRRVRCNEIKCFVTTYTLYWLRTLQIWPSECSGDHFVEA